MDELLSQTLALMDKLKLFKNRLLILWDSGDELWGTTYLLVFSSSPQFHPVNEDNFL